jgi:prevent-host-death family protein
MTEIVNMRVARTKLTQLIERARAGEEIIIAKAGEPLVRLVPVRRGANARVPGRWRGKVWMAKDFNDLPDDILDAFERKPS